MQKSFLLTILLALTHAAGAQPWMPKNGGRVKYLDAVANYKRIESNEKENLKDAKYGGAVKEDEDYHFDRWSWYWKQHLDSLGYIVSSGRTRKEWREFMNSYASSAAKTTASATWTFQGPSKSKGGYSGIGRINVVAFDPVDSNILYAGSAAGSTWKSTNGGATWKCLYDNMPNLSVTDIKVNPLNGNTIYVLTGDVDGSDEYSTGVIKSTDGGTTWTSIGPGWTQDSFRLGSSLLINPIDTNKLIFGASTGLYKSSNGGATWQKVYSQNLRQVVFNPADTAVLHATADMGSSAQILQSADGGYTWTTSTSFFAARRIALAVCPAMPTEVKAIAANNENGLLGVYVSHDFGATFDPAFEDNSFCVNNMLGYDLGLPATNCGGQGWYDLCIAVDPLNPDNVTIGGINNYHSVDGGYTWEIANQWYSGVTGLETVHADKHWLGYNPLNHCMYLGCDGGIYKTYSPLTGRWKDITDGIGVTQFYRNAVANGVTFCLGGSQDNGSKKLDAGVATDMTGGDGMQCLFNYADPEFVFYCAYQNGHVDKTTDGGINFSSITDDLPTPGAWITPYVLHPTNPANLYIGYKAVYASLDNGTSWDIISPQFSSVANIDILTIGMDNPDYIYAVRNNGASSRIHYTANGGDDWGTIPTTFTNYISDLVVDPLDAKRIWVTLSGYNSSKVLMYEPTTGNWVNQSAGLPNIPVNCMVIDTFSKTKYVGTDAAVFYRTTEMTSWALYNNLLPNVNVYDLNINHSTNEIWAATYGRSMWKSPKLEITPTAIKNTVSQQQKINIAPNPCHGSFTITSPGNTLRNQTATVSLITTDGKTMYTSNSKFDQAGTLKVDISDLPAGFYICELTHSAGTSRGKLVVY